MCALCCVFWVNSGLVVVLCGEIKPGLGTDDFEYGSRESPEVRPQTESIKHFDDILVNHGIKEEQ